MYAWFHYFGDFYTCQHPRDTSRYIYFFSRRSALVRPSERVPFFQECYVRLVYQMTPRDIFPFAPFIPRTAIGTGDIFSGVLRTPCLPDGTSRYFSFRAVQPSYGHRNGCHSFFRSVTYTLFRRILSQCAFFFFLTRFSSVPTYSKATNFGLTSGFMHVFVRQLLDRHTTVVVTSVLYAQVPSPA